MKCDVCSGDFEESNITTVNPSQHLGKEYPNKTSFCPTCFVTFLRKAKSLLKLEKNKELDKIKDFTK